MSLVRWIVAGFGWEVGKTAAKEAVDAAREKLAERAEAEESAADRARREKEERKRAEAERKARAKEAARREKEIDRELAALKKRLK